MGNEGSSESGSGGGGGGGMADHCWNEGYSAATADPMSPDPVGDGIAAAPCVVTGHSASYGQGYVTGVAARDGGGGGGGGAIEENYGNDPGD